VDLRDSPEEAAFRAAARAWLEEHLPPALRDDGLEGAVGFDELRAWSRSLHAGGWAGLTWPREHGGRGLPPSFQAVYLDEEARSGAPAHVNAIGLGMAGPALMAHGSDAQKERYLGAILSADEIWCQGFSEPGAGSDLASLRTIARLDGDRFLVDGQKVWSTLSDVADLCLLLARTDETTRGHAGITCLVVAMDTPGVEVRPIRQLTGESEFGEIFFSHVEVPVGHVLGEIGGGWQVAVTTLSHERGTLGLQLVARLEVAVRRLIALARERGATSLQRDAIAREWIELQALRDTGLRGLAAAGAHEPPGPEGSLLKLQWSEANQRVTALALELLGPEAGLGRANAPFGGAWQHAQLRSRGNTIEAGTSEILRSIIAERVLGLPRSR
jgi:alkylation response protein AidB-like acyl-CoA dehydrogenase